MKFIDNLLNKITMYRLVLYYLLALLAIAAIFGAFGILPYNPLSLIVSTLILMFACLTANKLLAKIFHAQTNVESAYITSFILALIITPISLTSFAAGGNGLTPGFATGFWFLIAAAVFAMASKYILAINKKHIFNPAAVAVALTAIFFGQYASWWVGGNVALCAFVVIGGLLVVRKLQHFDLVIAFGAAAIASIILTSLSFNPLVTAEKALIHTTLLFFAFVMLTEPLTTPPTRPLRIAYGLFVGALFSPAIHIGSIYSTPELTLVVGNIFSYLVSPKGKHVLKLESKTEVANSTYDFTFESASNKTKKKIDFQPGQYMEFTLGHKKADSRGNRRYFTIASSPTENEMHLGVKFYGDAVGAGNASSSFKKAMLALKPGDAVMGGQLAGDFVLPRDPTRKLVFIAGGIGITPFRSMIKYLSDRGEKRDIVLLYSNRSAADIAYREVFDEAAQTIGLKTVYIATGERSDISNGNNDHQNRRIDANFLKREVPDYQDRMFYLSGPRGMVTNFEETLREAKIPGSNIKIDFFPGFA